MGRIIPYMKWKIVQSCLKPPTRIGIYWDYLWDLMGCDGMYEDDPSEANST